MKYTYLGDTGLEVSWLCLGCMNFGSSAEWMMNNRQASLDLLDSALDAGTDFLDTANAYSRGESEEIVGEAIAERDHEKLAIAAKVYFPMGDGPNKSGLSCKHVIDQAHASLDHLGTDYIGLYQVHCWDDDVPVEEVLSALDHLVEEGLARYVGASIVSSYQFTRTLYTADVENLERFACMQPEYNAVDRHEEVNLLPVCEGEGVGVVPWSPPAGGFLTGKYERDAEVPAGTRVDSDEYTSSRFINENRAVPDAIRAIVDEKGATSAQVSPAWLPHKPVVDAPIIGPRRLDHFEENVGALDVALSDDDIGRIEAPRTSWWLAPGKG